MSKITILLVTLDKVLVVFEGDASSPKVSNLPKTLHPYLNGIGPTFTVLIINDNGTGKNVTVDNYRTENVLAGLAARNAVSSDMPKEVHPKRPPRLHRIGTPCPTFAKTISRVEGAEREALLFKAMGNGKLPVSLATDDEFLVSWLAKGVTEAAYMTIKRHMGELGLSIPTFLDESLDLIRSYFSGYPVLGHTEYPTYPQLCYMRKLGLFDLAT